MLPLRKTVRIILQKQSNDRQDTPAATTFLTSRARLRIIKRMEQYGSCTN